jgi:M6 family metalloprotease-like protein
MKSLFGRLALSALCVWPSAAMAVPAFPGLITVTQPDGTALQVRMVGDEYGHYFLTPDGVAVVADGKRYCYARIEGAEAVSTAVEAHDAAQRSASEQALISEINTADVTAALGRRRVAAKRAIAQSGLGVSSTFVNTGSVKVLVILVQFSDVDFCTADGNTYFTNMLNQEGFSQDGCTGSATDYFRTASNGLFTPQFDVYGPVTLPNTRAYYGASDTKSAEMVTDAAKLLDSQINFKDYDANGDGYVDTVCLFFAGEGENTSGITDYVWPHQWTLSGAGLSARDDSTRLNNYICTNEATSSGACAGIGTFIHEFSHALGLPDLYSGDINTTPGYFDVMDWGCYLNSGHTPPTYSSFERNGMKWNSPQVLSTAAAEVELQPLDTSGECCLIPTSSNNEFFLLENRQLQGWDRYLPNHGLLVWHIDYDYDHSSGINSDASHGNIDIVEANCTPNRSDKSVQAGYTFPGTTGLTDFTASTTPALTTWAGTAINIPITSISENGTVISFDVSGGFPIKRQTVEATDATAVSSTGFTANWGALSTATGYYLTLKEGSSNEEIETAAFGSGTSVAIPYSWYKSFSASKYYSTEGFYGEASPSLKMETDGNFVRTRTYTADVTEISFWIRGYQNRDEDALLVEGNVDDEWVEIATINPLPTTGEVRTLSNIPAGVKQVRFTAQLNGYAGTIAFDDAVITAGGMPIVDGYNQLAVGNVTSKTITGLTPGMTYKYTLTATDAEGHSTAKASNGVTVTLPDDGSTVEPETPTAGYGVPSGNSYADNYLTAVSITPSNGDAFEQTWQAHPGSVYNRLGYIATARPGDQIALHLTANSLSSDTQSVWEDMRYCCAYIYTDWDCDYTLDIDEQYGEEYPAANVIANYATVMDINHTLTVPEDAAEGVSTVRIIYQNAWTPLNDGACSTNLEKGIAYDFIVDVSKTTGLNNADAIGSGQYFDLQGRRVASPERGLYIERTPSGRVAKRLIR